jgi:CRISPR-associated protein Cas5h
MLGAILGYTGYSKSGSKEMPEYYKKLKGLKIAIQPLYNKPLKKVITGFNNASGLGSDEGVWQIKEQILVGEPFIIYRIFILEDTSDQTNNELKKLKEYLKKNESEYPLYFGKNEFFAHYKNYKEYEATKINNGEYYINSLIKNSLIEKGDNNRVISFKDYSFNDFDPFDSNANTGNTIYEYLPYDFDDNGFYLKDLFVFTENKVIINNPNDFYKLTDKNGEKINVQFI